MSAPHCARAWQAEAVEDGRLAAADAASFARHAASCQLCAQETRWLVALKSAAARLPPLASSELEQRRLRNAVLQRANALALRRSPARSWRLLQRGSRAPSLAATMAVLGFAALLALENVPSAPTPRPSSPASAPAIAAARGVPGFELTASPGASWATVQRSATLKLAATRGRFQLAIDELGAGQRFLVELPDGELEVRGTRFSLDVEPARTLALRVSEGRVELRLRGHAARTLSAGEAWSADPQPPAIATDAISATSTGQPEPGFRERTVRRTRPPATKPARGSASVPAGAPTFAGRAFAAAMTAFSAGDYGHADRLFAEFERVHAGDARVEDAAFLRAVAHSRRGDRRASQAAARDYLRRYPNGLRRAEAERLAR